MPSICRRPSSRAAWSFITRIRVCSSPGRRSPRDGPACGDQRGGRRRNPGYPYLFVGWAWYLGTLVPMIGLVQVGGQQMADRYTYFPIIGLFIAIVWLVCALVPGGPLHGRLLPTAAFASLGALAGLTYVQIGYWHDDLALFGHAVESGPDNFYSRNKLGTALVQRGKLPEAIEQFKRAIELNPHAINARYNLGLVYQNAGRADEAVQLYRAVLVDNEAHGDAHNNLGAILLDRGKNEEAEQHFQRAAAIDPTRVEAQINLGAVYFREGKFKDAVTANERAWLSIRGSCSAGMRSSRHWKPSRRWDEAIAELEMIVEIAPGDEKARAGTESSASPAATALTELRASAT